MFSYLESIPAKRVNEYFDAIEVFARDEECQGKNLTERDALLLVGAILNVENIFIRFDKDDDNVMNYNELQQAYPVYKGAILLIAGDKNGELEKYAPSIFYYLIMKKRIPKAGISFWMWHQMPFWSAPVADRADIAKVLAMIVSQLNALPE